MIFRIYDKFPFLYIPSDFNLLVIFRVKIWHKLDQFSCLFWMVLSFKVFFWPITWSEVRQNEYKGDSNHCMIYHCAVFEKLTLLSAKILQNWPWFIDDPRHIRKMNFFGKSFFPIRFKIILKVKFEDHSKSFLLRGLSKLCYSYFILGGLCKFLLVSLSRYSSISREQ